MSRAAVAAGLFSHTAYADPLAPSVVLGSPSVLSDIGSPLCSA
jgi:hypothetical protein